MASSYRYIHHHYLHICMCHSCIFRCSTHFSIHNFRHPLYTHHHYHHLCICPSCLSCPSCICHCSNHHQIYKSRQSLYTHHLHLCISFSCIFYYSSHSSIPM